MMRYIIISLLFFSISFSAKSQTYTKEYKYKALVTETQKKGQIQTTISNKAFDIANNDINPNLNLTAEAVDQSIEILENKINKEKSDVLVKKYKKTLKTMKARKKYIQTL